MGLQAYHWQILVYLAWFSSITHLSGLTVLRSYLSRHPTGTYLRYALMAILLMILIVAIVPTGFFNWLPATGYANLVTWEETRPWCSNSNKHNAGAPNVVVSAAHQASPARCFHGFESGIRIFTNIANGCLTYYEDHPDFTIQKLEDTAALQAMILSVILLIFGFISRSVRLLKCIFIAGHKRIRQPLSNLARGCLNKTAERRPHALTVTPLLACLLTLRMMIDLFNSMLAEVRSNITPHPFPDISKHAAANSYKSVVLATDATILGQREALSRPIRFAQGPRNGYERRRPLELWSDPFCSTPYRPCLVRDRWLHGEQKPNNHRPREAQQPPSGGI